MESGDIQVSLGDSSWHLGLGELCGLVSRSTDNGIMVTMRLGSCLEGLDSALLDLSVHCARWCAREYSRHTIAPLQVALGEETMKKQIKKQTAGEEEHSDRGAKNKKKEKRGVN